MKIILLVKREIIHGQILENPNTCLFKNFQFHRVTFRFMHGRGCFKCQSFGVERYSERRQEAVL